MRYQAIIICALLAVTALALPPVAALGAGGNDEYLGRWDITVSGKGEGRSRFCWLELTKDGAKWKGRFNPGGGAQFPLQEVAVENGELKFQFPQGRPADHSMAVWKARLTNGKLEGTAALGKEALSWTGVRAPVWPAKLPNRKPGKPVALFNGKDVSGWLGQIPGRELGWSVKDGILQNSGSDANNIYTARKFQDFRLEVEFNLDKGSNSGVYLRGRYEIQIVDGVARPLDVHSQGALYGFIVPPVNADKPAGEWQSFDITLIANRLTVVLNGIKIIDDAEVPGITGGALDANESGPGPIMIQGDHGKVQFRKIVLTPMN